MRYHKIEHKTIICGDCQKKVKGWTAYNEKGQIIDSNGYMDFADGEICDECCTIDGIGPDTIINFRETYKIFKYFKKGRWEWNGKSTKRCLLAWNRHR